MLNSKYCGKCKTNKKPEEFYFYKGKMCFGCKECRKKNAKRYYEENRESRLKSIKHYFTTDRGREVWNKASKIANVKHKKKWQARYLVHKAVRKGQLVQFACEKCGNFLSEAHHPDYSKPLEVLWLCRKHHRLVEQKRLAKV